MDSEAHCFILQDSSEAALHCPPSATINASYKDSWILAIEKIVERNKSKKLEFSYWALGENDDSGGNSGGRGSSGSRSNSGGGGGNNGSG